MNAVFIVLASALVWLSYRSFLGGIDYLRFFERELALEPSGFTPFVTVFMPCRGIDEDLEENLAAVISQDYPAFELVFIVDDSRDPAVGIINGFRHDNVKMVVAPAATESGQKVENLRTAVEHADPASELFVFVDSDVRPGRMWLRRLIGPLADASTGASTGYRWFISRNITFASELRSVWNASIASALGPRIKSNFCWGGSMAISRQTFMDLDIRERWRGTLSDDFTVTGLMKDAGLPIVFVPGALTASRGECTFSEMLEFTTRQMKITRVYARHLWVNSLIGSALFVAIMVWAVLIVFISGTAYLRIAAGLAFALVTIFSLGKAWLRLKAVRLALTDHDEMLKSQRFTQLTLWLLTPAVFLYNSICALFSRRIVWRGIVYELKSPTETVIIPD